MRILVIEDEIDLNNLIAERLRTEKYVVDSCFDGISGMDYFMIGSYDGAIIDIMLPGINGYEILEKARENKIYTPVLFLSAKDKTDDIFRGLDIGADDYLTKPFEFAELLARLRAMLRKSVGVHDNTYRCEDLELYEKEQTVMRSGKKIDLTAKEFAILLYLLRNKNMVVSRDQIMSGVWADDGGVVSNVVDVYIRYIRRTVDDPFDKKLIQTVRGAGYKIAGADEVE